MGPRQVEVTLRKPHSWPKSALPVAQKKSAQAQPLGGESQSTSHFLGQQAITLGFDHLIAFASASLNACPVEHLHPAT